MPRTKEQNSKLREIKRKRILDASLSVFADKGYGSATIEQIALKAEISKGLVYSYFRSKEELLQAVFTDVAGEMNRNLDPNQDGILEKHELEHYIDYIFDQVEANPDLWRLYFLVSMQPEVSAFLKEQLMQMGLPMMRMMLAFFQDKGYEEPEVEMAILAGLITGAITKYIGGPEFYPLAGVRKRIKEMYIK